MAGILLELNTKSKQDVKENKTYYKDTKSRVEPQKIQV